MVIKRFDPNKFDKTPKHKLGAVGIKDRVVYYYVHKVKNK